MGGVYRDQGFDTVSNWLSSLIQCRVEAAYQTVRKEYLLPPTTTVATPQTGGAMTRYPSPPISSRGARPDAPSNVVGDRGYPSQRISQPQTDLPQQGPRKVDAGGQGSVSGPPDVAERPSHKRRRRRSNPKEGDSKVAGEQCRFHPRGIC